MNILSPELRDRLLYYAGRAPSPHNAQGWLIETDDATFRVSRDPARQVLREFDPEGRETDLACGAVVTNLCVGARAFGFEPEIRWRPDDQAVAEVTLRPAAAPPDQAAPDQTARDRLRALRRRAMNRSPYRPDPVPRAVIDALRATAGQHGFTLSVLTDRAGIGRMAATAARAGVMKLTHAPTQAELHALMRFGPQAAARERDGLDLELFFTPAVAQRLAAVATHPRVLSAAAPLHVAEMIVRDTDEAPLRSAPALCLLYADALAPDTFGRGGACFEEIALDVTEAAWPWPCTARRSRSACPTPARCRPRCPPPGTPASPGCAASCWPRSRRHRTPCRSPSSGSGGRPANPGGRACGVRPRSPGPRPPTTGR